MRPFEFLNWLIWLINVYFNSNGIRTKFIKKKSASNNSDRENKEWKVIMIIYDDVGLQRNKLVCVLCYNHHTPKFL